MNLLTLLFSVFLGFVQGLTLGSLFFVIYSNKLSSQIVSTLEQLLADEILFQLVADDILFFIGHNVETSAEELNSDLEANLSGHPQ